MPPWCSKVGSKMGVFHFRLEIVILECNETRGASYNYYDKRCADKLKKTLAFMGKLLRYFAKLLFF